MPAIPAEMGPHLLDPVYIDRTVRIINQDNGRTLYAETFEDPNLKEVMGAGPNRFVNSHGNWKINGDPHNGYRIVNVRRERVLYAHRDKNGQEGFGAGIPENHEGDDGYWRMTQNVDGSYRVCNKGSQRLLWAGFMEADRSRSPWDGFSDNFGAVYQSERIEFGGDWYFIFTAMPILDRDFPMILSHRSTSGSGSNSRSSSDDWSTTDAFLEEVAQRTGG